jgi:hypothetical protein
MMPADPPEEQEYWNSLASGDSERSRRAARRLAQSSISRTSEAFYSAICVLLAHDDLVLARSCLDDAIGNDGEAAYRLLLPLVAHASQRALDLEAAHLTFQQCERLGLLQGRNEWALQAAREVAVAWVEREYWDALAPGDPARSAAAARQLVDSPIPRTSDAFYSAICVLLRNGDTDVVIGCLEDALRHDFGSTHRLLLPLLAHAHQRAHDAQTAHLIFQTCDSLGLLQGRNEWAGELARSVTLAMALQQTHRMRSLEDHGNSILVRLLYEDYLCGAGHAPAQPRPRGSADTRPVRLPDFIVAGSAKCGTTFLYDLICASPSVWNREPKEIHYFSRLGWFGPRFYSRFFEWCPDSLRCGEASPSYFDACNPEHPPAFRQDTAEAIAQLCPSTKIIVVLRDPALRAISLYNQLVTNDDSRGPRPGRGSLTDLQFSDIAGLGRDLLISGKFVLPLRRYTQLFGADRFLVLTMDDFSDLVGLSRRVSAFLDIECPSPERLAGLSRNAGHHARPHPALYRDLRDYYQDSLADLELQFGIRL